ncbi:DUF202 domain-containing protein [Pseudanabaena sp. FACHB-2040]|uniref:DUF202 domain-containing protein n=1 Tax=Pseudanabaena sp. FACHB-2040 TaxID=2692859 RepID=UPI001686873E|nr:DUF202 domain-containing protein [Pseudanabaena sp. FACHB-2040]
MTPPQPKRPTGATNELAKERNRAAAERTLASWIGNCLALIGFGMVFDQIYTELTVPFPMGLALSAGNIQALSLLFIGTGLLLLVLALAQHRLAVQGLEREEYVRLPINAMNRIVVAAVVLFGLISLVEILLL